MTPSESQEPRTESPVDAAVVPDLADRASRCVGLRDGSVVHDGEASREIVRQLTGG